MMKKSKVMEKRVEKSIEEKEKLLNNIDRNDALTIKPLESRKNPLVLANNLQIKYDKNPIFNKVSFEINNGDRVCFSGKNGAGKSSIIKLILGNQIEFDGDFKVVNDLKISYVSQSTENLKGTLRQIARESEIDGGIFKAMLLKMGVSNLEFEKMLKVLVKDRKRKF